MNARFLALYGVEACEPSPGGLDLCSINTATLGYQTPIEQTIEAVARAGFGAIAPWRREVEGRCRTRIAQPHPRCRIEGAADIAAALTSPLRTRERSRPTSMTIGAPLDEAADARRRLAS